MARPIVTLLCLLSGLAFLHADDAPSFLETTLTSASVKTDTPSLLAFFKNRTLGDAEQARLAGLVRQLGADVYLDREKASEQLIAAGRKAVSFLRPALTDPDREIRRRAARALTTIDPRPDTEVVLAAAGLLVQRKAAGAEEVLLAYLPYLEEETAEEELVRMVFALTGKPTPGLLAALKSSSPRQRAAAAYCLGRCGSPGDRDLVVGLLRDTQPGVRFRAAEGLLLGKDRRGLAGLIDLLGDAPIELATQAEELLGVMAGEHSPAVTLAEESQQRRKCLLAWQGWLREHGPRADLARIEGERAFLGYRLAVANGGYGGSGAVWEYGSDRKARWEMRNVGGPFDAVVLPGGRLLVAEYNDRRVSERDMTGKVLWEYRPTNGPLEVQRLPGGNTLVCTNYEISEVTRAGKVVFQHRDAGGNLFSAQKLPGGNIVYGLYSGELVEIDRAGKEINRFAIEKPRGLANIVVLPGSRYLLPLAGTNRIIEMDRKGKVLREIAISSPTTVAVLTGGNLLVGSHILNNVREIDRNGKLLYEHKAGGQVFRVRAR